MEGKEQPLRLKEFRNLLSSSDLENIPSGINENEHLLRFLRFKENPQRAYQTFVKYHKFRHSDKELFSKLRPGVLKYVLDGKIFTKQPGNDANGWPVLLLRCKRWNASGVSVTDIICVTILLLEEISRRQSSGVSIVIDWDGFGFAQYRQITYRTLVRGFAVLQGTLPISFKGIHQLNPSIMFSMVSKIFFSLLSAKLKKRIHIHGTDLESFAAHIPKSSLPVEYGGTSEEDEDREFMDTLYKNEDYYCKLTEHFRQT
ncbi:unnamed protein product [Orchesella dallaii]|uniref:CRAL-TRIO domain-containing protein n=1 Tax=Orchesella dallaii TaxID=48710 RepID=A0ABP1RRB9_9HEXA